MGEYLEYVDVVQEVRGAMHPGRLKLQSGNIVFKNIKTGVVETISSDDVEGVSWLLRARGNCLKFKLNSGQIHRFDGLQEKEFDRLSKFITNNYNATLEKVDMSYKGWNWGDVAFIGNTMNFNIGEKLGFEIPLGNVSHSMTGKNEVTLEFHQNDDAQVSLMEARFHIPTGGDTEEDRVQEFYEKVIEKADIIQATGDAIAIFQEVQCLTPRGRYDIKIYPTFLQLHGKTFDYKISFTTILRLFLLPHRDGRQMFFVVSLDPPIKQGMTRYPFIISLFNKEDETTLELGLSEEELTEKYEGKLTKEMSGLEYEVVSRIMKSLVSRKIIVPGSFLGHTGTQTIACSYKAATGLLYPLERGFIFVHKPPMHIRFDEISCVNFGRSAGNTRSFDFDIDTKAGGTYTFVGIEKEEYQKLYDFVTQKKLRVKNIGGKSKFSYADSGSEDEGNHDAYMERMKREGKGRIVDDMDDDDDDSSDESFNPDNENASDIAEEYDSNPETTNSEDSDYKAAPGHSDSGGSGGVSEDEEDARERQERKERKDNSEEKKERKTKTKTVKEGTRKRRTKKDVDPDRPKRATTSYMLWLATKREEIKEKNPGISIIDITKKAGEMWRGMTSDDKKEFDEQAAEAREKYQAAMAEYKATHTSPKSNVSKKVTATRSPQKASGDTARTGPGFKSKEFISSSESEEDSDKPLKSKTKKDKSDEEMDVDSDKAVSDIEKDSEKADSSGNEASADESD